MRWQVHGERSLHESDWMSLRLVDVEIPGGRRFDHHVVRLPCPAVGTVVHDPRSRCVLLLWRHRFITDTWGWEIPAGRVERGEELEAAAVRETIEETGWRPGALRHLLTFNPASGVADITFHVYLAAGATYVGEPVDVHEAERIEWVPLPRVRELLAAGEIRDGMAVAGLAMALALEVFD
jgi:8-oxo-dGTP pyrophosphatase MutT (NUDIX family)